MAEASSAEAGGALVVAGSFAETVGSLMDMARIPVGVVGVDMAGKDDSCMASSKGTSRNWVQRQVLASVPAMEWSWAMAVVICKGCSATAALMFDSS